MAESNLTGAILVVPLDFIKNQFKITLGSA